VDLELTEDQELLRATTRRFLESQCPLTVVRSLEQEPAGYDAAYWRQGAELGWTSMLVPEADGGGSLSGEGLLDLAIVAEELGRLVSPGPLVPTNVVADAVARRGTPAQRGAVLPGIVGGELVAAWAYAEPVAAIDPTRWTCRADRGSAGWVLRGRKLPVEAAAKASVLLVTAMADEGPTQFLVPADTPGVAVAPMGTIDLTRRYAAVELMDVALGDDAVVGEAGGAVGDVARQLQVAAVLACAESAGATDRVLEFTLEYLDDRYSFGRPLSSYQALKHRCADMKMWLEACHAAVTGAARAVQREQPDADMLASAAKAYVGTCSTEIIQDCVQLHGGIGVTWEHDIHLYLRRATVNRGAYGSPAEHRERIAVLLGMGARAA
jgi:alkylation response protein AidB-like acyl-CoA dehydrogenase